MLAVIAATAAAGGGASWWLVLDLRSHLRSTATTVRWSTAMAANTDARVR